MNDWIGLGFLLVLAVGAFLGLYYLSRPRPKMTEEEFNKRAAEGGGFAKIGVMELQKIFDPAATKSVEVVEDFKGGKYDQKQAKGDGNDKSDAEKDD